MEYTKKEELLSIFVISLALVSVSLLVYMSRTPQITGYAVLDDKTASAFAVTLLVLAGLSVVIGGIISVHQLHKENEHHKKLIFEEVPNDKMLLYVTKARKAGFDDNLIFEKLRSTGWNEIKIKNNLRK